MTTLRQELFDIGLLAADMLCRFTAIQDSIRSWRIVFLVHVDFAQHAKDARMIRDCFDGLITRVEAAVPSLEPTSKEAELAQTMGRYLCAVLNSVTSYEHLTRLMAYHEKRDRIVGAFRVLRARREFDKRVGEYLSEGIVLQRVWEEAKHA